MITIITTIIIIATASRTLSSRVFELADSSPTPKGQISYAFEHVLNMF